MKKPSRHPFSLILGLALTFLAGATFAEWTADPIPSDVVSQDEAVRENFDWGSLYTYFVDETYGTKDALAAVAIIKPGWEIHPPHEHAEEEILMVLEGEGTWHLNGKDFAAKSGDMLYAYPWEIHGVKNTGDIPLKFVVWKWNNKGVALPTAPSGGND